MYPCSFHSCCTSWWYICKDTWWNALECSHGHILQQGGCITIPFLVGVTDSVYQSKKRVLVQRIMILEELNILLYHLYQEQARKSRPSVGAGIILKAMRAWSHSNWLIWQYVYIYLHLRGASRSVLILAVTTWHIATQTRGNKEYTLSYISICWHASCHICRQLTVLPIVQQMKQGCWGRAAWPHDNWGE